MYLHFTIASYNIANYFGSYKEGREDKKGQVVELEPSYITSTNYMYDLELMHWTLKMKDLGLSPFCPVLLHHLGGKTISVLFQLVWCKGDYEQESYREIFAVNCS